MRAPDWLYRAVYRYGFRAARLWLGLTRPRHSGTLVMLWCQSRVLLVRTSYQRVWMAPGGGVEPGEHPLDAAVRELSEELGLELHAEELRLALVVEHLWNNRHDRVHLFEAQLAEWPTIKVENREVIEALCELSRSAVSHYGTASTGLLPAQGCSMRQIECNQNSPA